MTLRCAVCEVSWDGQLTDRCWTDPTHGFGAPTYPHSLLAPVTPTYAMRQAGEIRVSGGTLGDDNEGAAAA